MNKENLFKTYLYIGEDKFSISVKKNDESRKFYENQILVDNFQNKKENYSLDNFLDENIFKIEKLTNSFIKDIYIIIDNNDFLNIEVSIRNKNYGNKVDLNKLKYSFGDIKNEVEENNQDKELIHMIINRYMLDNNSYLLIPKNIKCEHLFLEILFICLSKKLIKQLETTLSKYQIKVEKIISAKYIKSIFKEDEDIFKMCELILQGFNANEIVLIPKIEKNKGFFEKFFNLFS